MDFLEWDQAVRAAVFGGIFLLSLFAVLWVWYDGAGGAGSGRWIWRIALSLLVAATLPAVVLGAANLDSDRESLFNITAWTAIGSAIVALFGTVAYAIFGRDSLMEPAWTGDPFASDIGDDNAATLAASAAPPMPSQLAWDSDDATKNIRRAAEPIRADAYFVAKSGRDKGRQFPIADGSPAIIGRSDAEASIVLDDERVSSAHGQVRLVNGNYTYVDMNSTNGSFLLVEGRSEPIRKPQVLVDGDEVRVGHTVLAFVDTRKASNR